MLAVPFRFYFPPRKAYLKEPQPGKALNSNAIMQYINMNFTKGLRDLASLNRVRQALPKLAESTFQNMVDAKMSRQKVRKDGRLHPLTDESFGSAR